MSRKHGDEVLLTPGPVNVPDRVLEASARPLLHHRTPRFAAQLRTILTGMREIFQTKNDVLLVHGTGRAGLEATVSNLFSAGEEVLSICNGRFGVMYSEIFERYGVGVTKVATDWSKDYDPAEVLAALKANPRIKAITVPFCETSTGVINDVSVLGDIAREYDKLLLVDAVSSLGGVEFRFDEWGVDAAVTGSQKGLMSPPGLAFAVLSDRAWKAAEQATLPHYYFDFRAIRKTTTADFPGTPGTTPVTLVAAAAEAVSMIMEEGLPNVWQRYEKMAAAVRAGFVASGLKLFPEKVNRRSPTVTVVEAPDGFEAGQLITAMTDEFGLIPASGLGPYSKRLLRFGTMGAFYQREALITVAAVEAALVKMGVNKEAGAGVKACVAALFEE
ncbi:MAG: alanine--glyoxylate aminotransferase family protein [Bacillota bacterium]